jgi:protein-disulfide isomerase
MRTQVSNKNDRAARARRAKVEEMRAAEVSATRRRNLTVSLSVVAAFALVIAAIVGINAFTGGQEEPAATGGSNTDGGTGLADSRLVRTDSHRLSTAPDGKVTLVEFLDFECAACGAAFPTVEQLREDYEGKVTFVARYFPLPGHFNAERAARAVEAAAQQGKFEAMYQRMFETQTEWGEQQVPADDVFRGFAEDLDLDMSAWDKAYADPATLERIRKDVADGQALGVQGTPSFFLNGEQLEANTPDDFKAAIDAALAK